MMRHLVFLCHFTMSWRDRSYWADSCGSQQ